MERPLCSAALVILAFTLNYEADEADVEQGREITVEIMAGDERMFAEPPPAAVV